MADCEHFYSIVSQTSINNNPVGTHTYYLLKLQQEIETIAGVAKNKSALSRSTLAMDLYIY